MAENERVARAKVFAEPATIWGAYVSGEPSQDARRATRRVRRRFPWVAVVALIVATGALVIAVGRA